MYKYLQTKTIVSVPAIAIVTTAMQVALAGNIYEAKYQNQADVKIFRVKYENQADLCVFVAEYANQAKDEDAVWHYVEYANQADAKIFFVKYSNKRM